MRAAIQSLPLRERKVIGLYYYGEVTMKQIGAEIGVNESRVSQLHARAIRRLREALGEMGPQQIAEMRKAFRRSWPGGPWPEAVRAAPSRGATLPAVVLPYKPAKKLAMARADAEGRAVSVRPSRPPDSESTARPESQSLPSDTRLSCLHYAKSLLAPPAEDRQAGTAWRASGSRSRSRNCSASVPATSPVTKMTRLRSAGTAVDSAR